MVNATPIQPEIIVLTGEAIEEIHSASLKILGEFGIRVDSAAAINVFKNSPGIKFIDENHLTIQAETVEWAMHTCPSTIEIYNRSGDPVIHLGEDRTKFGIGVTNLFYQDPGNDEILPFSRQHMRQSVSLGNRLSSFDVISTIGILRDVDPKIADLVAVLEMVANTTKLRVFLFHRH